jgi:hypothetical protein
MKITKKKHPKMVESRLQARLRDEEEDLQASAAVNNGPQEQPRKVMDEEKATRQGPSVPALSMKKMAKGGEIDQAPQAGGIDRVIPDKGFGKIIVMKAEGGEVSPESEIQDEEHSSLAAAIMAKRRKMANGGIAEETAPQHEDDNSLLEGQVDIDDNARELPNSFYKRNEDAALKENYDEDIMDMSQPMDSNEHGDDIQADVHDRVSAIRNRMIKRRVQGSK